MIKEFSIGFSRTINLGNYESARIEASVTMEAEEDGEPFATAKDRAQQVLRQLIEQTWREQYKQKEPAR